MQDAVHAIGAGAGGRIFTGSVGDRRLRPHSHHLQQALKCPRCDSPNTKFCYYNNYNLSQPRHFCKSCRRYWTKGGVLRNVPVGGGCRKAKRSSKAKKDSVTTVELPNQPESTVTTNKSSSSSTETAATQIIQDGDHKTASSVPATLLGSIGISRQDDHQATTEVGQQKHHASLEGFTMMMTSSSEDLMGFSTHDDHMMNHPTSYGNEFKVVDYGDPGLFDLTAAVDPNYWNDQSSLNFLP